MKNLFLLGCYTGLSFTDLIHLSKEHLINDNDGRQWIIKARSKTKVISRIPVLNKAKVIIDELMKMPNETNFLFRKISNFHTNAYLKELADLSGINKNLTFHMSRHTFATTITVPKHFLMKHRSLK